jgi:hypothetical protein
MRTCIWKFLQTVLFLSYLAFQLALYLSLNSRIDDALDRIRNLEIILGGRKGIESVLTAVPSLKEASTLDKMLSGLPAHEHTRLKRSPLASRDVEIATLLKRLQYVESR